MQVTFTGTNSYFLQDAFFDSAGTLDSISVTSPREVVTSQVVIENSQTGMITTLTGTDLRIDAAGNPTQGTVTAVSFAQAGQTQATISGISWSATTFLQALVAIETSADFSGVANLINAAGPLDVDASGAAGRFDFQDPWDDLRPLITQPITVLGSGFSDFVQGGNGDDTLDAGSNNFGEDDIEGTPGNDEIRFSSATPQSFFWLDYENIAGSLTVTVDGAANTGSLAGPGFTDTLVDVQNALLANGLGIEGSEFADVFTVDGGAGSWTNLRGNEGADTFNLTLSGDFRLSYNSGADLLPTQGLQINLQTGVVANDGFGFTDQINIAGGSSGLEIRGTDNDDSVTGSALNEGFIAEQGNDFFDGGGGLDAVRYDRAGVGAVNVNLFAESASVLWDGNSYTHTLRNVEFVRGSRTDNDTIAGDADAETLAGYGGDDILAGNGGDDQLYGEGGNDTAYGGLGNDYLDGFTGNDSLFGGDGLDTLYGAGDDDTLMGGTGNDLLGGGGGNDSLLGGGGADALWTSFGHDTAFGGPGNDSLGGFDGNDSLEGGTGDDELWGANGNDSSQGGPGNDTLGGAAGDDSLDGGSDNDELWGADGHDWLNGSDGNDQLGGGNGADSLYGGTGQDTVSGGWGNDLMGGDAGDDLIFGAGGNDFIEGGAGADTIYGGPGADTISSGVGDGDDTLSFFSLAEDRLRLDDALWTGTQGTLTPWQVVNTFGAVAGADYVLDFGGGDSITLTGLGAQTDLYAAIDIF